MSTEGKPHCAQCGKELDIFIDARTGQVSVRECTNPDCPSKKVAPKRRSAA